ncbi:MAG: lipopolysaccharide biosynthesis protein [Deltaproteobacteria bacterium]|nr:lipopolysaccharide biosynthesis protein [Deltaproteobacteria bacterium]
MTESSRTTSPPEPTTTEDRIWSIAKLLSGNLLGTFAGAVFFLTASWTLPIEQMGHYAVAISTQWIAVGLVGSGLSIATLRLAADRLGAGDLAGAAGVVSQSAVTALTVTLVAVLVCWAIGAAAPEITGPLPPLIAGWAGARSVIDCIRSGLLASQSFGRAALLMVGTAITGLTALAVAVMSGPLTLEHLLMAHVAGLSAGVLVAVGFSTPLLRDGIRFSRARQWELLRYARWPSLAEGTRLLQINIGPILLVTFSTSSEAGLFGVARYPAYIFDIISLSLYQYWLSTAVRRPDTKLRGFLGSQLRLAAVIGALAVLVAFAVRPLLGLLGSPFVEAAPLFVLNVLDFAILLLVRPAESTYHGLRKPWLEWIQRGAVLPVLLLFGWLLGPRFGAQGMIWTQIMGGIAALVAAAFLLRGRLDSIPTAKAVSEP